MFGSKKCPVIAGDKLWVEQRFCWLAEVFGIERMLEAQAVVPSRAFFPERFTGSQHDMEMLFERVCGFMQVDPRRFELVFHDGNESDDVPLGIYYGQQRDGTERISILRHEVSDPMSLIATISHELAHALLLGDRRISQLVPDHEWVTDLTTIFLGLGVFGSNSVIREQAAPSGGRELSFQGYMSELHYAYALAIFAWTRGELRPSWASDLRPNVRAPMKQALRYLAKTNDSLIGPDGHVDVGRQYDGHDTNALIQELQSSSASQRLASLCELRRRGVPAAGLIEPLTELLLDSDTSVSDEAASLLGSFGPGAEAAVPTLLGMVADRDPDLRLTAVRTLGDIGAHPKQIVPALQLALDDDDRAVRDAAAISVGQCGEESAPVVEDLNRRLAGVSNETILATVLALGMIGEAAQSAVPTLLRVLDEGEGEVREAAVVAIGEIGDKSAPVVTALCAAAADDDVHVRDAALDVLALLKLDNQEVQRVLSFALEHEDLETRTRAAIALSTMDEQVEPAVKCFAETILPLMNPNGCSARDVRLDLVPLVAQALEDSSPRAVQTLIQMLNAKDDLAKSFAVWALGRIGTPAKEAADTLRHLQTTKDTTTGILASIALWRINENAGEAIRALVSLCSRCDLSDRLDAVFHLCKTRSNPSATAFGDRLRDLDQLHRAVIHLAIRDIGDQAVAPLIALLADAGELLCSEIAALLAALDHVSESNLMGSAGYMVEQGLDMRKWISQAQIWQQELARQSRHFALLTMAIPESREPISQANEAEINEAEWLLICGISQFAENRIKVAPSQFQLRPKDNRNL